MLKTNFAKAVQSYDASSDIQTYLFEQLLQHIPLKKYEKIVDLGSGTGQLTHTLFNIFHPSNVVGLDCCEEMVRHANENYGSENLRFEIQDLCYTEVASTVDMIISNAALQWVDSFSPIWKSMIDRVKNHGVLAFSTFFPTTFFELQESINNTYSHSGKLPVQSFRVKKDYERLLGLNEDAYIYQPVKKQKRFTSLMDLLLWIKTCGISVSKEQGLWTKEKINHIEKYYVENFGGIIATFDMGIFVLFKN